MQLPNSVTALLCGVALFAAACSPNVYKQEIAEFSKAMKKTQETFEELRTQDYETKIERVGYALASNPKVKLIRNPACTSEKPENCGLVLHGIGKDTDFPVEKKAPELSKLLGQMVKYAEALATVAGSENADAVTEAAGKLGAAIKALPAAAKKSSGKVDASLGFLESAFKWIAGAYVDQKRYRALKSSVVWAHLRVVEAGKNLKISILEFFTKAIESKGNRLRKGYECLSGVYCPDLTRAEKVAMVKTLAEESRTLRALVKLRPTFEGPAKKEPDNLVDQMVVAHLELTKALMDESNQAEAVFDQIKAFADLVGELSKALKAS